MLAALLRVPATVTVAVSSVDVPAGGELDIEEVAPILEVVLTGKEIVDLRTMRAQAEPQGGEA